MIPVAKFFVIINLRAFIQGFVKPEPWFPAPHVSNSLNTLFASLTCEDAQILNCGRLFFLHFHTQTIHPWVWPSQGHIGLQSLSVCWFNKYFWNACYVPRPLLVSVYEGCGRISLDDVEKSGQGNRQRGKEDEFDLGYRVSDEDGTPK